MAALPHSVDDVVKMLEDWEAAAEAERKAKREAEAAKAAAPAPYAGWEADQALLAKYTGGLHDCLFPCSRQADGG